MDAYKRGALTFEVTDAGPPEGRAVLALHGFPEDRHCWESLSGVLAGEGFRVLAPDQRGYSPGARPEGRRSYVLAELAADVLALADAAGCERFDVIGHDWGAAVAWELAGRHSERVRSLTALAVPHPRAFQDAVLRSDQLLRSWYMLAFQLPRLPEEAARLTGPERTAARLERDGLDVASARRYAGRLCDPASSTPAINWYRALPYQARHRLPPVDVATLFVWGERDHYVSRYAADRCSAYVTGPYRFEALPASHWLPSAASDSVAPILLEHLRAS